MMTRFTERPPSHLLSLVLLLLLVGAGIPVPGLAQTQAQVQEAIDEVRRAYVPDGRLELFQVEVGTGLALEGVTTLSEARNALLRKLDSLGVAEDVSVAITVLPDPALGQAHWGLVTVSVSNLRTRPGHSQELTTQVLMGTPVRILMKEGGWLRIRTPEGYIAWVDDGAVHSMTREELDRWNRGSRMMFVRDFGLLHESPGSRAVVSDVSLGGIVGVLEQSGEWTHVILPDGRGGWLPSDDLMPLEGVAAVGAGGEMPQAASLIALARIFMGRPYLWGGTSAHGVDCSGFMKTVFHRHGIILSRDANQQVLHGREIPFQGDWHVLEPGDLLFFGRAATSERAERVTHVAMYMGQGRYIHSSGSPARVGINSLEESDPDFNRSLLEILLHVRRLEHPDGEQGPWSVARHPWYGNPGGGASKPEPEGAP